MRAIDAKAVIGSNCGDEGKGLVTDLLADEAIKKYGNCLVVCNNGGAQRSHTVTLSDGTSHAFRHIGSGTFAGADTYMSEYFILNPIIFREEFESLYKMGYSPKIYIDKKCRITTPFEMYLNQMLEESRGELRHGSCGLGIWETVKVYREYDLGRFNDYMLNRGVYPLDEIVLRRKQIFKRKLSEYMSDGEISQAVFKRWKTIVDDSEKMSQQIIYNYIDDLLFMLDHSILVDTEIICNYSSVVFENGQGLLLNSDVNNVHTTPSNTGMDNIREIEQSLGGAFFTEPYYVTRTYMTRHGAGEFSTECESKAQLGNLGVDQTNVTNKFQGALRYGNIDSDLFNRIERDAQRDKSIVITHVNERLHEMLLSDVNVPVSNIHFNKIIFSGNKTRAASESKNHTF